jgi:hypothetical protein
LPSVLDLTIPVRRPKGAIYSDNEIVFEPIDLFSPCMTSGSADVRMLGIHLVSAEVADGTSDLTLPPSPPPAPRQNAAAPTTAQELKAARDLIVLPDRFTGKRPLLRFARSVGFDRLWLRMHKRRFRRAYESIGHIIDYLQREKRA